MPGGYVLDWTAWRVWLHPKKASHALDQLSTDLMTTEERLRETLDMLEEQRRECVRLTTSLTEISERLIVKENELVTVRRERDIARADLAEHESVDAKIAAFSKELSRVEAMKRQYEKTISTLKSRLADAKRRLGEKDNYDLFETIVMTPEANQSSNPPTLTPQQPTTNTQQPTPNNQHLTPNPQPPTPNPSNEIEFVDATVPPTKREIEAGQIDAALRSMPKKKAAKPGEIRAASGRQDEDDWLIPLPDL